MSKARLSACPTCARHVRVSEAACPFCGAALPAGFRAELEPRAVGKRLGRAALYALGAGTLTVTAACSSAESGGPADSGTDSHFNVDAAYGGPAFDAHADAPIDASDAQPDTSPPLVDAAYGGPPIDASDAGDAQSDTSPPLVDAAYGGPPIDASHD